MPSLCLLPGLTYILTSYGQRRRTARGALLHYIGQLCLQVGKAPNTNAFNTEITVVKFYNIVNKTNNTHGYDLLDENLFCRQGRCSSIATTSPVDK